MAQRHTYEGTAEELAFYLAKRPKGRFKLVELPDETTGVKEEKKNLDVDQVTLTENAKVYAALALLDSWIAEGKSADETTRATAEQELGEFKRSMNANRLAAGESLVYP